MRVDEQEECTLLGYSTIKTKNTSPLNQKQAPALQIPDGSPFLLLVRPPVDGIYFSNDAIFSKTSLQGARLSRELAMGGDGENVPLWLAGAVNELKIEAEARQLQELYMKGAAPPDTAEHLRAVMAQIERDLPGANGRRKHELALAKYIREEIEPHGRLDIFKKKSMVSVDFWEVAQKLEACRQKFFSGWDTKTGKYRRYYPDKCGMGKLCPDEARVEAQRVREKYVPAVMAFLAQSKTHTFQAAVYTMPNVPADEVAQAKRDILARYNRMSRTACMDAVKGSLVIQEDPLAADRGFNVHLNVVHMVDGKFSWKAVRREWGYHVYFDSEADCKAKTITKLELRGEDTSNLTRRDILQHAFTEICKYATQTVPTKSANKLKLSKAPAMVEWTNDEFRAWFAANHGFRRTRGLGVLYDPPGYVWTTASRFERLRWLRDAELGESLSVKTWRKGDSALDKEQRDRLRDLILGIERSDLRDVQWAAVSQYVEGFGYATDINLIQGDKFTSQNDEKWVNSQCFATGKPFSTGPPGGAVKKSAKKSNFSPHFDQGFEYFDGI